MPQVTWELADGSKGRVWSPGLGLLRAAGLMVICPWHWGFWACLGFVTGFRIGWHMVKRLWDDRRY